MYEIRIKRIYEEAELRDGFRVLVDRLWPRGISKEKARIDFWAKKITPSNGLRIEFHTNFQNVESFIEKYKDEILKNIYSKEFATKIQNELLRNNVTFLYASKNNEGIHAKILKEWVENY